MPENPSIPLVKCMPPPGIQPTVDVRNGFPHLAFDSPLGAAVFVGLLARRFLFTQAQCAVAQLGRLWLADWLGAVWLALHGHQRPHRGLKRALS